MFFSNCAPESRITMEVHTEVYNLDAGRIKDYLSYGIEGRGEEAAYGGGWRSRGVEVVGERCIWGAGEVEDEVLALVVDVVILEAEEEAEPVEEVAIMGMIISDKTKLQNEKVLRVLQYLDDVIQHQGNKRCVMKAHKLPIGRLKWFSVQEPGSDDCGVNTARCFDLEQFNEEEAAKLKFTSEEGRINLVLDLILCGENIIRNEVIQKAQQKYRNTRRII
ncbi:hypothetical protein RHSIM_Rhsim08G0130000 [Rhododendron simsii]|uniref:Uncharacterized protein n=1 Tax=Rhododendron simsii TaxID=118357 RepID=A0A834GI16_RHOSS|nr:hypothetical protein RHSIM_Rhsim08G0130000 [Rhododendron simsii]